MNRYSMFRITILIAIGLCRAAAGQPALQDAGTSSSFSVRIPTAKPTEANCPPRLWELIKGGGYAQVVRFNVTPKATFTMTVSYASTTNRFLGVSILGYNPFSQDTKFYGANASSGITHNDNNDIPTKTGRDGHRYNFSIDASSEGKYAYLLLRSDKPGETIQVKMQSPALPEQAVKNDNKNPFNGTGGYWGTILGNVKTGIVRDEKPTSGGTTPGGTTPGGTTPGGTTPGGTTSGGTTHGGTQTGGTILRVDNRKAKSGETVTIPVFLQNAAEVANLNFTVQYNTSVASGTSVAKGNLLSQAIFQANADQPGIIHIGFIGLPQNSICPR